MQEREQKRDLEELSALAAQGKPVYGPSDLPEYIQGVAHRNSVFSQLVSSKDYHHVLGCVIHR